MSIRPVYDGIVMMRFSTAATASDGVVIPDFPQPGEVMVVATGKQVDNDDVAGLNVSIGDRILFGKYPYGKSKRGGAEFMLVREDDILGVLSVSVHAVEKAK
jgi:chaperonin GroES